MIFPLGVTMRKVLLVLLTVLVSTGVQAKDPPASPNPPRLVNDFAGVLDAEQQQALESKLDRYFDTTTTQITVVIEQLLEGEELFDYCQRLASAWGIGEKGKDNGVLLYIAIADRKVRIHTGYGMEGVLPDAICKRIINNEIKPNFKQGDYYSGIDAATTAMIAAAAGEYTGGREHRVDANAIKILFVFIIIVIIVVLFVIRKAGGGRNGGGGGFGGWGGPVFWGTFGSGGFSSRGSSWGGGSGGFGGFGGGSFGGGGASGSW